MRDNNLQKHRDILLNQDVTFDIKDYYVGYKFRSIYELLQYQQQLQQLVNEQLENDYNYYYSDIANKIREWIANDNIIRFYQSSKWRVLRAEVLQDNHNECEISRNVGIVNTSTDGKLEIHHILFIENYPHYALDRYIYINGKMYQNLFLITTSLHSILHQRTNKINEKKDNKTIVSNERWD